MSRERTMETRKLIHMPNSLADRIKAFRFARQINTESEAIRLLLEKALTAEGFSDPGAD